MHVDDWLDSCDFGREEPPTEIEQYAKWVIHHFRLPAVLRYKFGSFMKDFKLFAVWKGKKYRVTYASSMGDICLAKDFKRETGYDHRVDVDEITEWSKTKYRNDKT
jgi:hypothetical protein